MISSGQLTTKIEILSPSIIENDFGEEVVVWQDIFCATRCAVKKSSGKRAFVLGEVTDSGAREIILRYRPGITSKMRVRFVDDGSIFLIDGPPTASRADGSITVKLIYIDE